MIKIYTSLLDRSSGRVQIEFIQDGDPGVAAVFSVTLTPDDWEPLAAALGDIAADLERSRASGSYTD